MAYYIVQMQPHNDRFEILWEATDYEKAQDECDRINSNLADYGIPSTYYARVC